jgi:hypothetical protein
MFPLIGKPTYMIYVIKFQKRGLPHVHILIKYPREDLTPHDIDQVISAEIPTQREDTILVRQFMTHNHPSSNRPPLKYCQTEKKDGS